MPDALDQLHQLVSAPPMGPEPIDQLDHRVARHRRRRRLSRGVCSLAIVALIGAVMVVALDDRDSNEVHTTGQPPSTITPLRSALPFPSNLVVSSDRGIDLLGPTTQTRLLPDGPVANAYALGDSTVVAQRKITSIDTPDNTTPPLVIFEVGTARELPVMNGEHQQLLDVGIVGGRRVALVSSRTGATPPETNEELVLIDIASGARTDLGSIGGTESGVAQARLLADRVVLLSHAGVDYGLEARSLDGSVQWHQGITSQSTMGFAVDGPDVLLLGHSPLPREIDVTRRDLATGSVVTPTTTIDLTLDPDFTGEGLCLQPDWDGTRVLCNQGSAGPYLIDLSTGRTSMVEGVASGVATVTRSLPAAKVFDQPEATWGGTAVFLDDGTFTAEGFNTWLDAQRPDSAETAARAMLDATVSAASQTAGNPTTVTLTIDVQGDDSVSGIRYTATFEMDGARPTRFLSGTWAYRCARGDTTSFLPRLCA